MLTAVSIVFYMIGEGGYIILLMTSICGNFIFGQQIYKCEEKTKGVLLFFAVTANLLVIAYFKYAGFIVDNVAVAFNASLSSPEILLPLGVSFFTFTQIAYLVDMRKGIAKKTTFLNYILFVTYFPHLIAGPIIHYSEVMPQFRKRLSLVAENFGVGMTIFAIGLAKKVLIADRMALICNKFYNAPQAADSAGMVTTWLAAVAYSFQIYFDFSGYSDMAIGLSLIFGISLPINFASPYKARSIREFWRRCHITMSRFLRDYVYIPLGGNRHGEARRDLNMALTMVIGGLWHGAAWTFVIWGALHGTYLVVQRLWDYVRKAFGIPALPLPVAGVLTFTAVVFAWVPFRAPDMEMTVLVWKGMLGFNGGEMSDSYIRSIVAVAVAGGVTWLLPNTQEIMARYGKIGLGSPGYPETCASRWPILTWRWSGWHAVGISIVLALCIMRFSEVSDFIYFHF